LVLARLEADIQLMMILV